MKTEAPERVVVRMEEYQRRRQPFGGSPTDRDLALAEKLRGVGSDPRLEVRWLADETVEIQASSWVGSVQFSSFEVRVVPKLVGGAFRLLRMMEYASGVNLLRRLPVDRDLPGQGDDLFDLICQVLASEAKWLLRDGLLRDYRTEEETLEVLRGRLRHREQYLRRFGRLDRLECTFDEYDTDTPVNQLVTAGLAAARTRASDPRLRSDLAKLFGTFAEACQPPPMSVASYEHRIVYDRRNTRYRPAHLVSKLILEGRAFEDIYETSSGGRLAAFMLNMNVVFEAFVSRLVEEAIAGTDYRVHRQMRMSAAIVNEDTGRTYTRLRPDLVVSHLHTGRSVPIDVKYKIYDAKKISGADIYQTFMYAYALGRGDDERRAGIVYPSGGHSTGHRISVRSHGQANALIVGVSLEIPDLLDALSGPGKGGALAQVQASILGIVER